MGNLGFPEILLILLFILVFFGARKIPDIAQGLGKGVREFRKASREIAAEGEQDIGGQKQPAALPSAPASTCYYCGSSVPQNAKFCSSCGKSLVKFVCPKCRTTNAIGSKFCSTCGEKLA